MSSRQHRAVFLDRDGVLNDTRVRDGVPVPPAGAGDVVVLPGVPEACRRLAEDGWLLIVVTNQPDIARGTTTREAAEAITSVVTKGLPITEVVMCPHDDSDGCDCRKPLPGMITEAARRWDIDLGTSVLVGDRWRDIEAGRQAGVQTVLVDRGYGEARSCPPDHSVADLPEAADLILAPGFVSQ